MSTAGHGTKVEEGEDACWTELGTWFNENAHVSCLTIKTQANSNQKHDNLTKQFERLGLANAKTHFGVDGVAIRKAIEDGEFKSSKTELLEDEGADTNPVGWPSDWPAFSTVCGYAKGYSMFTRRSKDINTKVSTVAVIQSKIGMVKAAISGAKACERKPKYLAFFEDDVEFMPEFVEGGHVLELLKGLDAAKNWTLAQFVPSHAAKEGSFMYRLGDDPEGWLRTPRSTGGMLMIIPCPDSEASCPYLQCLEDTLRGELGNMGGTLGNLDGMVITSDCSTMRMQAKGLVLAPARGVIRSFCDVGGTRTTSNTTGSPMSYDECLSVGRLRPYVDGKAASDACAAAYQRLLATPSKPGYGRVLMGKVDKTTFQAWADWTGTLEGRQDVETITGKLRELVPPS